MESLTSIRLARIELRCLEKMEEDAAGKPGPWLRVLFTASYREDTEAGKDEGGLRVWVCGC